MKNLIYLGTSIINQRSNPLASKLRYCTARDLSKIKVSHDDYEAFLNYLKQENKEIKEIALISTCNRFEFIIFLHDHIDNLDTGAEKIKSSIFRFLEKEFEMSLLLENEARLQLLRTYCGLNSGLVGESEICLQINGAFKQALSLGTLEEYGMELLKEAQILRNFFNEEIYLKPISYCEIAIEKAFRSLSLISPIRSVCILGSGSTAIQSGLALVKNKIPAPDITLIHRVSSSSQQIEYFKSKKELDGMNFIRSKKHGYKTPKIAKLCSENDLIVFGIDAKNPVVEFPERCNQVIFDFNSNPSCNFSRNRKHENYFPLNDLDAFVREYSYRQNNDFELSSRLNFGERYIQHHIKNNVKTFSSSLA